MYLCNNIMLPFCCESHQFIMCTLSPYSFANFNKKFLEVTVKQLLKQDISCLLFLVSLFLLACSRIDTFLGPCPRYGDIFPLSDLTWMLNLGGSSFSVIFHSNLFNLYSKWIQSEQDLLRFNIKS